MKTIKHNRGFTLVELLVVIAIIGILASVVLISLNAARSKAQDVRVISGVRQIKTQLENDYDGVQYPDLTNTVGSQVFGGFDVNSVGTTTLNQVISDILAQGANLTVVNTPTTGPVIGYAIYGQLMSATTTYFCMDSVGNANQQVDVANISDPTCPVAP